MSLGTDSALSAAPVPRPPAPTMAIWVMSSTAECTRGMATPASTEAAVTDPVVFIKSRRLLEGNSVGLVIAPFLHSADSRRQTIFAAWPIAWPFDLAPQRVNHERCAAMNLLARATLAALTFSLFAVPLAKAVGPTLAQRLGYKATDKLLIINGDDTGMCHAANVATIDSLERGLMTSATIMVPCPWFTEIARYAKSPPGEGLRHPSLSHLRVAGLPLGGRLLPATRCRGWWIRRVTCGGASRRCTFTANRRRR